MAILIITYGYVYWGNLLGENTPAGQVIAWLSGEETKSLEFLTESKDSTARQDAEAVPESAFNGDKVEAQIEAEPVIDVQDSAAPAVDDSSIALKPAETPPEAEAESAKSSTSETVPTEAAPIETAVTESPADAGDAAEANIDTSEARRQPLNGITMHDLLMRARNAFHYRDYETAIASYQQLIERAPDHFDAYIELGDVYSYQGKEKQAAAAYFEAAAILVRLGQVNRATALMGPISRMDTDRARALLDLIDAARR
ncbi:MAG: tetratricopeptide repeat protein [Gammaproteobacteria bacterium]|nr:tetratricopeptide repeat protein [Gammaproteobacteria bacterium]